LQGDGFVFEAADCFGDLLFREHGSLQVNRSLHYDTA
jgi:hypothetical protein